MVAEKKVRSWLRCFLRQNKERNEKNLMNLKEKSMILQDDGGGERWEGIQKSAQF